MNRSYAKTSGYLHILFVAFFAMLTLSGCSGGVAGGYGTFGVGNDDAVVTQDPDALPDVAWQTNSQRQTLIKTTAPAAAPAGPARNVKVALLLPLTGKNADLGQSMWKAAQMAMFDVGGQNFNLEPQDTAGTPAGAAAAARTAIDNGADLILGPIFAEDVRAVKAAVGNTGKPIIAFTNDFTVGGGNTYVMGFLPFAQVARVTRYATAQGIDTFGIFAPQTPYADNVISTMNQSRLRITTEARYLPSQSDLSVTVAEFVGRSKPDGVNYGYKALMLPVGGESLNTVASVLSQKGLTSKNVRFIGTGLWDDTALNSNPALFGGWYAAPDPASRKDFEKRYQENYGSAAPRLASLAYDATAMSAVLARNGGNDPYSRSALTSARGFAGIDGVFRFRSDGLAERGLAVLEIQAGRSRIIDPAPTAFISSGM